jgi:hypothetical protein
MNAIRSEVANAIHAALPDVTVYDYEPDLLNLPAIVVSTGSPYIEPDTACLRTYNLEATVVLANADERDAPLALEQLVESVLDALDGIAAVAWQSVSGVGRADMGGQPVITMSVTLRAWRS